MGFSTKTIIVQLCFVFTAITFAGNAQAQDDTYLALLNQKGKTSKNFESDVEKAGGTVEVLIPEIGVAFVSSDDNGFKSVLAKVKGVQQVAYTLPTPVLDEVLAIPAPQVETTTLGDSEFWYPVQWGLDSVNAQEAWAAGATGEGVRVAVLDSGIDHDNIDLVDNINQGLSISFLPCYTGLNCDGNGFEDWRVDASLYPGLGLEPFNHGTHVAGIIAASANGGNVIGVAPDAEIVAIKVCTEFDRWCRDEAIMKGLVYASNIDADIVNMSIGSLDRRNGNEICEKVRDVQEDPNISCGEAVSSQQTMLRAYKRAFKYAEKSGTTVIVAAANHGLNGDSGNHVLDGESVHNLFFRFADISTVLSISALGPVGIALPEDTELVPPEILAGPDTLAWYSNYGRSIIDFAAPGGNSVLWLLQENPWSTSCDWGGLPFPLPCFFFDMVVSAAPDDFVYFADGTSMAAPHAAGVAAIIVGLNGGDMSPKKLRNAMKRTADDLGTPGHDEAFGDGRVNAGNAVQ